MGTELPILTFPYLGKQFTMEKKQRKKLQLLCEIVIFHAKGVTLKTRVCSFRVSEFARFRALVWIVGRKTLTTTWGRARGPIRALHFLLFAQSS